MDPFLLAKVSGDMIQFAQSTAGYYLNDIFTLNNYRTLFRNPQVLVENLMQLLSLMKTTLSLTVSTELVVLQRIPYQQVD